MTKSSAHALTAFRTWAAGGSCRAMMFGLLFGLGIASASAESLEQEIDRALHAKKPVTRGLNSPRPAHDGKSVEEQQFINQLRSRSISVQPSQPAAVEER